MCILQGCMINKKIRRGRKPVSVFESVIYLRNLPPGIGRAALDCRYIWFCRFRCRTRTVSPQMRRELLPRVFTLGPEEPVILCYGRRKVTPTCAFRSGMPFPVRTFLREVSRRQIVPPYFNNSKILFFCYQDHVLASLLRSTVFMLCPLPLAQNPSRP